MRNEFQKILEKHQSECALSCKTLKYLESKNWEDWEKHMLVYMEYLVEDRQRLIKSLTSYSQCLGSERKSS